MTAVSEYACDVCSKPATAAVRDIRVSTQPGDIWETYEPAGPVRYGCEMHPVKGRTFAASGALLGEDF